MNQPNTRKRMKGRIEMNERTNKRSMPFKCINQQERDGDDDDDHHHNHDHDHDHDGHDRNGKRREGEVTDDMTDSFTLIYPMTSYKITKRKRRRGRELYIHMVWCCTAVLFYQSQNGYTHTTQRTHRYCRQQLQQQQYCMQWKERRGEERRGEERRGEERKEKWYYLSYCTRGCTYSIGQYIYIIYDDNRATGSQVVSQTNYTIVYIYAYVYVYVYYN